VQRRHLGEQVGVTGEVDAAEQVADRVPVVLCVGDVHVQADVDVVSLLHLDDVLEAELPDGLAEPARQDHARVAGDQLERRHVQVVAMPVRDQDDVGRGVAAVPVALGPDEVRDAIAKHRIREDPRVAQLERDGAVPEPGDADLQGSEPLQDLGLLRVELLLREDAFVLEPAELLELLELGVVHHAGAGGRSSLIIRVLLLGHLVLRAGLAGVVRDTADDGSTSESSPSEHLFTSPFR
jgi:hypothetical protein